MPAKRYSLKSQIAEVERELGLRRSLYATRVASRAMSQGEADMHMGMMESALETLRWLERNQASIKAARENNRELWNALAMIREAVETHMPPGALPAGEHTGPTPTDEAEALVKAILAIASRAAPPA